MYIKKLNDIKFLFFNLCVYINIYMCVTASLDYIYMLLFCILKTILSIRLRLKMFPNFFLCIMNKTIPFASLKSDVISLPYTRTL